GRIRLKIRSTVSRLCASTSGREENTSASWSGSALKSGMSSSTPVPWLTWWICRTVSAYSQAPPSSRSSRATPVTVAYRRPMACTEAATRRGSSASNSAGLPVSIWQKSQRRVHCSPPMRNVASRSSQHSKMFGQPASSHTVCRSCLRTNDFSEAYSGPLCAFALIQAGLSSIGVWELRAATRSIRRPSGAIVIGVLLGGDGLVQNLVEPCRRVLRRNRSSEFGTDGSGVSVRDPARDDVLVSVEVVAAVQRQTVHRHTFVDADADGPDLAVAPVSVAEQPDPGASFDRRGVDAVLGEQGDHGVLELRDEEADLLGSVEAVDEVGDELTRSVPGDLSAPVDVDDVGAVVRPLVVLGAFAGRVDRGMLEQQDRGAALSCEHFFVVSLLQIPGLLVVREDRSEPERFCGQGHVPTL